MQAHELKSKLGKKSKTVGRGGKKGTYSGRGGKGQSARAGFSQRATFSGGSGASIVPKAKKLRGFKSSHKKNQPVNLEILEKKFTEKEEVNPQSLLDKKIIHKTDCAVKILADGKFTKELTFKDVLVSAKAKEKIEGNGGKIL